jgi:hypothetical protein
MLKQNIKVLKTVFRKPLFLALAISLAANLLAMGYFVFSPSTTIAVDNVDHADGAAAKRLIAQVNPEGGYALNIAYGDLGPKVLQSGVIDLSKFRPLNEDYRKILTQDSSEKITIRRDNAYFLLNFFWALGLANKNPILEEGPITKYGENQIGSFASTGGWSLGTKKTLDFYSTAKIIPLTPDQQARVEEVAANVYRPCCNNPTSFPDCNHGMALLGVLELLAANNASTGKMYEAAKYFNAFWFPQQYLDLAIYFKAKDGQDFKDIDAKLVVGQDFSSARGWSKTKKWLAANNLVEKAPAGGGGCGV